MNIENKINKNILTEWRFYCDGEGIWSFNISKNWRISYDLNKGLIQLLNIDYDGGMEVFYTYATDNNLLLTMERYRDLLLKVIYYYHQ